MAVSESCAKMLLTGYLCDFASKATDLAFDESVCTATGPIFADPLEQPEMVNISTEFLFSIGAEFGSRAQNAANTLCPDEAYAAIERLILETKDLLTRAAENATHEKEREAES